MWLRGVEDETAPRQISSPRCCKGIMKTPAALQPLVDDGVIDEVIRSLKSGKEAIVYLVRSGTQTRCAKVYRDMRQRSFQKRARYQEGRKVRGTREIGHLRSPTDAFGVARKGWKLERTQTNCCGRARFITP